MAHIYGQSGAEETLLEKYGIRKFEDINVSLKKSQDKLDNEKSLFLNNLPNRISNEKDELESLKRRENEIGNSWDERIRKIEKTIDESKIKIRNEYKVQLLFTLPVNYVNLFVKKNLSKPKAMKELKKDIEAKGKAIYELENEPEHVFQREQENLISEINKLEIFKKSPEYKAEYKGALGENLVLDELKKLNDNFHIFCDIKIMLPDYVQYRDKHNLKSAQMDFVLVGPTGIFVIEVKNWSDEYLRNYNGISPYEQVERAGRVLYIYLNNKTSILFKPRITNLLVPIQSNLHYDKDYKFVFVRDLPRLREFIQKNKMTISDINEVVSHLENLIKFPMF